VNTNETAFSFTSLLNPPSPLDPNRAQCCIKTGLWKDASKLAEECLSIDRSSVKVFVVAKLIIWQSASDFVAQALYRRGFARLHLGLLVEAEVLFLCALFFNSRLLFAHSQIVIVCRLISVNASAWVTPPKSRLISPKRATFSKLSEPRFRKGERVSTAAEKRLDACHDCRDKQVFSKLFSSGASLYADAPPPAPAQDSSKQAASVT
jgi:hypothetical protein